MKSFTQWDFDYVLHAILYYYTLSSNSAMVFNEHEHFIKLNINSTSDRLNLFSLLVMSSMTITFDPN